MEIYDIVEPPGTYSDKGLAAYCNERAADGWRLKFITQTEGGAVRRLIFAKEVDAPDPG